MDEIGSYLIKSTWGPRMYMFVPACACKLNALTLSDALTCYDLSVPLPETRICFAVITTRLGSQWGMTTRDENTPGVKCDSLFSTCTDSGKLCRAAEWQVRPAGHPRTGLNTMIGSSGARPDKQFHSRNITDTEWKFECNCRVTDFHWALLCRCQSGVLLSPWWQCDGPWATEGWRCIMIFVKISLMNTWKLNHAGKVDVLFSRLVDMLMIYDGDLWKVSYKCESGVYFK